MQVKIKESIFTILYCTFITISSIAQSNQSVNISFSGINNNTKNYQVILDRNSFFSNKNYSSDNNTNSVTINNLEIGKHTIKIYKLKNNNPKYNNASKKIFVYTKTFDLREGYNMDIEINANGRVQFSETSTTGFEQIPDKTIMADAKFNSLLQIVRSKWSQALKGETESEAFNNPNNYFSTSQLRQLLILITSENDRLDLTKLSYRSVLDSSNFTQLSDLFKIQANKNEFNDFLRSKGWNIINDQTFIKMPMSDSKFNPLLQSVRNKWSQALKGETESEAFNNPNNYFNTSQIRQLLTLITSENDRLDLVKLAYRSVTDSINFTYLNDLFKTDLNRNEFNNFLRSKGWNITNDQTTSKMPMRSADFDQILSNVRANLIQFLKVNYETDVFNNPSNYFSTNQIRQLLFLINSENNRLDLAKLSYKTVTDSANFFQLNDLFNSQISRDELANYVKNYRN